MAKKNGSSGAKIGRGSRSPSSKAYKALDRRSRNKKRNIARDARLKAKAAVKKELRAARSLNTRTTVTGTPAFA